MDKSRAQFDDLDSDENIPLKKRRSSILKPRKSIVPDLDDTGSTESTVPVRRVSFAASNFVKPFVNDPDKFTIWDTTYEEAANHTDSTKSENTNPTTFTKSTSELETMTICGQESMEISSDNIVNLTLQRAKVQEKTIVYEKNEGEMEMTLQQNTVNVTQYKTQIENATHNLQTDMSFTCRFPNNIENINEKPQRSSPFGDVTQNLQSDMSLTCRFPKEIIQQHATVNQYRQNSPLEVKDADMSLTCRFGGNASNIVTQNVEKFQNLPADVSRQMADMSLTCRFPGNINLESQHFQPPVDTFKQDISHVSIIEFAKRNQSLSENINLENVHSQNYSPHVDMFKKDISRVSIIEFAKQTQSLGSLHASDVIHNQNVISYIEKENFVPPISPYPIKSRPAIDPDIVDKENIIVPVLKNFTKKSEVLENNQFSMRQINYENSKENINTSVLNKPNISGNGTQFMDVSDHDVVNSKSMPVFLDHTRLDNVTMPKLTNGIEKENLNHVTQNSITDYSKCLAKTGPTELDVVNPNLSMTVFLDNTRLDNVAMPKVTNDIENQVTQHSITDYSKCLAKTAPTELHAENKYALKADLVLNFKHSKLDMHMKPSKTINHTSSTLLEESDFANPPMQKTEFKDKKHFVSSIEHSKLDMSMKLPTKIANQTKSLLEDSNFVNPPMPELLPKNDSQIKRNDKFESLASLMDFSMKCPSFLEASMNLGESSTLQNPLKPMLTEDNASECNFVMDKEPIQRSGSSSDNLMYKQLQSNPQIESTELVGIMERLAGIKVPGDHSFENIGTLSNDTKHDTAIMEEECDLVDISGDEFNFSLKSDRAKSGDPIPRPAGITMLEVLHSSSFNNLDDTRHYLKPYFQKSMSKVNIDQSIVSKSNIEPDMISGSEAIFEISAQLSNDSFFNNIKTKCVKMRLPRIDRSKYESELKEMADFFEQVQTYLKNYSLPKLNSFDIRKAREEMLQRQSPNHSRHSMETTLFVRRDSQGLDLLATVQERVVKLCAKLIKYIKIESNPKDDRFLLSTLYETLFISVKINADSGQVLDIRFSSLLDPEFPKICHFTQKFVIKKLTIKNLSSYLGEGFDILSLVDYIYMTVEEGLAFQKHFVMLSLRDEYTSLKIDPDFHITCALLNLNPPLGWQVTIDVPYINKLHYENVKIVSVLDRCKIKEDCIKKVFKNVEEGPNCLKSFLDGLYQYFRSELANLPKSKLCFV